MCGTISVVAEYVWKPKIQEHIYIVNIYKASKSRSPISLIDR